MLSLIFYLIIIIVLGIGIYLYVKKKRHGHQQQNFRYQKPIPESREISETSSPYNLNFIVIRVNAFPGKEYMGYELHQTLLDIGMRLGNDNLFHYYNKDNKILFSLAASTSTGCFVLEDLGAFRCSALFIFMNLHSKIKLMSAFNLMLDTARHLVEELGGEIIDDECRPISTHVIRKFREKICDIETTNQYNSDLLDNLDP